MIATYYDYVVSIFLWCDWFKPYRNLFQLDHGRWAEFWHKRPTIRVCQETPVAKRDQQCQQCSQGKVKLLENLKEWWRQGGISEGQASPHTCCLTGNIPGKTKSHQGPFSFDLFRLAIQMIRENRDVKGVKRVRNDAAKLCLNDRAKRTRASHFSDIPPEKPWKW